MNSPIIFYSFMLVIAVFFISNASQTGPSNLSVPCPALNLTNGRVNLRRRGTFARFNCNPGYALIGTKRTFCTRGRWRHSPPVCTLSLCDPDEIGNLVNGLIIPKSNRAILMFFCNPGYELQGPSEIYCLGETWNTTAPICKSTMTELPTKCDFEKADLCGWEQDPSHDFDWTRHHHEVSDSGYIATGPIHDHTLGSGFVGHYLYIEASGKPENTSARIMSPLYSYRLTVDGCFSFWYHMHGVSIGTLNIYFKEEGFTTKTLMFSKTGNQVNRWLNGMFNLPNIRNNFQIVIEGYRGLDYESGIAVDDVAVLSGEECSKQREIALKLTTVSGSDEVEIDMSLQTCRGRCSENITDNATSICQCNVNCAENSTCCPDYFAFCDFDDATVDDVSIPYITIPLTSSSKSNTYTTLTTIYTKIYPVEDTDNKRTNVTKVLDYTTLKYVVPFTSTLSPSEKSTNSANGIDNEMDSETSADESSSAKLSHDTGKVTLPGIISIVVGSIVCIAGLGCVGFIVFQKRNNYKKGAGNSTYPGDSDVMYLTSDEVLDFSIARPEDM